MLALHSKSRRSFLSNLTVLSAGIVLSPMANVIYGKSKSDVHLTLMDKWNHFCKLNNAQAFKSERNNITKPEINASKGHTHKAGDIVLFKNELMIAQPVWIYWPGINNNKPSDVIIHFFDKSGKKISTINRFELEALNNFWGNKKDEKLLPILLQRNENVKENYIAKVFIKENNEASIYCNLTNNEIAYAQNIF